MHDLSIGACLVAAQKGAFFRKPSDVMLYRFAACSFLAPV